MPNVDPFALKQVRGRELKLPKHANHCVNEVELKAYCDSRLENGALLGADLFCGAGGLSQGLREAGIEVVFGVDHYDFAVETHAANFPGMSVDWDLSTEQSVVRVADLMKTCGIEVLAGGPPCQPFSRAGRPGIRHLVETGKREPDDQRRNLWRAYLEVVERAQPRAVIMENVPDMALDNEMFIFRSVVEELEQFGYSVEAKVIDAWRYGVPQVRQRLIVVALKDDIKFNWPDQSERKVTLWNAIGDLPNIEPGWDQPQFGDGWLKYDHPITEFQHEMRLSVSPEDEHKVYDHITRAVRDDDREAFELMTPDTKYSDLPEHLQRYRTDIFKDKYKKLDENDLCRTITAHISKDGYSYIHPRQTRTLSVREAARVQTFPDSFRFSGPPSAAFKQIGNAVPVKLGKSLGEGIVQALINAEPRKDSTRQVARHLSDWYDSLSDGELAIPWARSTSRWRVLLAEFMFDRVGIGAARHGWSCIATLPDITEGSAIPDSHWETLSFICPSSKIEKLNKLRQQISSNPSSIWEPKIPAEKLTVVPKSTANFVELVTPIENGDERSEEYVLTLKGALRVTTRYQGMDTETRNKQSDGRISIARMVGLNSDYSRNAQKAVFEIAKTRCLPKNPICSECPLREKCEKFAVAELVTDLGALPSQVSLF